MRRSWVSGVVYALQVRRTICVLVDKGTFRSILTLPLALPKLRQAAAKANRTGKKADVVASEDNIDETSDRDTIRFTAEIVASYVSNNPIAPSDLSEFVKTVHSSLSRLGVDAAHAPPKPNVKQKPATPISRSIHNDHIVCLEDGKKLTMLKRYLRSRYDLSPEDYRRKWGLPPDYPMVAPDYANRRSQFAKAIGLGKGVRRKDG